MPGTINDINDTQELDDRVAALLKGMHAASERIMRQLATEEPELAGPEVHANGAPASLLDDLNADLAAPDDGGPAGALTPDAVNADLEAADAPLDVAPDEAPDAALDSINAELESPVADDAAPELAEAPEPAEVDLAETPLVDDLAEEATETGETPAEAAAADAGEPLAEAAAGLDATDDSAVVTHDLTTDAQLDEELAPESLEPPAGEEESAAQIAAPPEIGEVEGQGAAPPGAAPAKPPEPVKAPESVKPPEPARPVVAVSAQDINSLDVALAHAAEDLMAGEPAGTHEEPAHEVPPEPIPMPGRPAKAEARPAAPAPRPLLDPETPVEVPDAPAAVPSMPRPAAPARPAPAPTPRAPSLLSRLLGRALRAMASPLQDQPVGVRKAVGYIALNTLFWAGVIWCYLLFFREPVPPQPAPPAAAKAPASKDAGHAPKKEEPKKDAPKKSGGH